MIGLLLKLARSFKSTLRFRFFPRVVDSLTTIATLEAPKKLKAANVECILIDNTVLAHGVTHETAWVDTGKALWGDTEIDTGYAARSQYTMIVTILRLHDQSASYRALQVWPDEDISSLRLRTSFKMSN